MNIRALIILFSLTLAVPVSAQTSYTLPDFSGIWKRSYQLQQAYDPPASGPGPIVQDPRYPHINHNGILYQPIPPEDLDKVIQLTEAWVPDLTNPILQLWTREALEKLGEQELSGIPHPELQTHCLPSGTPHVLNLLNSVMILQTPTEVIFLYERDHHVRHVYLDQPHIYDSEHTWFGDSVGHYEGDTLVVDTIGENGKTDTDRWGTPHSDMIHVVERYRFSEDGQIIQTEVTVEDHVAFTIPWSARAPYVRQTGSFLEIICAENNEREFWMGTEINIPEDHTPDF